MPDYVKKGGRNEGGAKNGPTGERGMYDEVTEHGAKEVRCAYD